MIIVFFPRGFWEGDCFSFCFVLFALFSCAVLFLFCRLFFSCRSFFVVQHCGRQRPIYTTTRPLKSLRASVPDSHNSCGRMWIHEFSRFFNNRGLVEVEGQRGGTNFCCDVVGFTVFLRLGCLHVPVMEGRSQYIDVLGLKFAKKNIKNAHIDRF